METFKNMERQHKVGFYSTLVIAALLTLYVSIPYLGMFIIAFVLVLMSYPIYEWLLAKVKKPVIASLLTTFFLLIVIAIPVYLFFAVSINQFTELVNSVDQHLLENPEALFEMQESLSVRFPDLNIDETVAQVTESVTSFVKSSIIPLAAHGIGFFIDLTFFILFIIYMFLSRNNFINYLKQILPMKKEHNELFVDRFTGSTTKVMLSIVVAAAAQAASAGIAYFFLGIPAVGFWIFAMFFVSFLPLGSGLITIPIAILMMLTGNVTGGLILIAWHAFVVSTVDNVVRAKMFQGGAVSLPELLTFITTLGGVAIWGFAGVIYGPLIAVAFMALMDLYEKSKSADSGEVHAVEDANH